MLETDVHLKRQYLVASDEERLKDIQALNLKKQLIWNGYSVFTGRLLTVTRSSSEKVDVLLLGFLIHHEHHQYNDQQLLSWIVQDCLTNQDVIDKLQECGGRYVALIQDQRATVAITDACAMRQLYWSGDDNQLVLSSSARLILDALGQKPQPDQNTVALLQDLRFRADESPWYGDKWIDGRINKVIANHVLDLKSASLRRMKYHYTGPTSYGDILGYACNVLTGLIEAIHSRAEIIQPITAGYDSRLLLAASRKFSSRTRYYIFDNDHRLNRSPDVKVATGLCKKLDLSFEIIIPRSLREDFLAEYRKKCYFPRIIPNTLHIQWHYDVNNSGQICNINGNCAEIARFQYQNRTHTRNDLKSLINISGYDQFFAPQIESWYSESIDFCKANNINIYDLFYWEQRMSNWGAMYRFETDIAIEELTVFNHKNLLFSLLRTDLNARKGPQFLLNRDIINHLWPEVLSLPFNPVIGLQLEKRSKRIISQILGTRPH